MFFRGDFSGFSFVWVYCVVTEVSGRERKRKVSHGFSEGTGSEWAVVEGSGEEIKVGEGGVLSGLPLRVEDRELG